MSKRLLQVPRADAKSRIEAQIQKGANLLKEGISILKNRRGPESPRERDNFEVKYRQWEDLTSEVLREIFVSGSYAHDFEEEHSSVVEYVNSSWVPDIRYYVERHIVPKLDFLEILMDNLDDFEQTSKVTPTKGAIASNTSRPASTEIDSLDKLTVVELFKRLRIGQAFKLASILVALLIGAFTFGYTVYSWKLDREKIELSHENERLSNENAKLQAEVDSLKKVGASLEIK